MYFMNQLHGKLENRCVQNTISVHKIIKELHIDELTRQFLALPIQLALNSGISCEW